MFVIISSISFDRHTSASSSGSPPETENYLQSFKYMATYSRVSRGGGFYNEKEGLDVILELKMTNVFIFYV